MTAETRTKREFPGMKTSSFVTAIFASELLAATLSAQEPVKPGETAKAKTEVGISSRDGFSVSGGEALITRNGITEKLMKEVALPNGTRVQVDGKIVTKDGAELTLRTDQVLTFDGQLLEAPAAAPLPVRPMIRPATPAPGTAVPFGTPPPATPRPHIRAGEGVQK